MSIKQLQARIEQLSVDIDRQKEVLKQLECSKSDIQRELNGILDPVARLPLEISSEIFIQCLPLRPEPGAFHAPTLFLNICNAWTDIALATSALWASIRVKFSRVEGFSELLAILEIYCGEDDLELSIWLGPCPFLATLTIGRSHGHEIVYFSTADIRDFLRLTPNLVECTFDNCSMADDGETETLLLPSLRHLAFGDPIELDSDDVIFKHLTLPALETLAIPMLEISTSDLVHFLERSSPPLRKLTLGAHHDLDLIQLEKCIRLSPTIVHLQLQLIDHLSGPFFAALTGYLSHSLPNLHTMTVRIAQPEFAPASYETLLRALSVRRTQIGCFELIWSSDSNAEASQPAADICASFRQLVADGMKVHIGTEDHNYISA
ncbi:hypothetical protein C8R44DRAFT_859037 [Mycena epipterygia]|nr:hypothetical protein C8R44DRAFT_859037 [Mycena epipterygia]